VTLLVDTKVNAILDLHVTTTRKHDSQIAPSLIKRNPETIDILLGDKGYDDQKIRRLARHHEVRPLIKHREFTSLHKAWNARLDADLYGQRSQSETVNSTLKRKYGAFVRSRQWWKQFRELVLRCLVHNIDRAPLRSVQSKGPTIVISSGINPLCMSKVIWTLAVAYGLVGLGLFYSLAVDSSELFLAMTTVIYVLMLPLAYLVYKNGL